MRLKHEGHDLIGETHDSLAFEFYRSMWTWHA